MAREWPVGSRLELLGHGGRRPRPLWMRTRPQELGSMRSSRRPQRPTTPHLSSVQPRTCMWRGRKKSDPPETRHARTAGRAEDLMPPVSCVPPQTCHGAWARHATHLTPPPRHHTRHRHARRFYSHGFGLLFTQSARNYIYKYNLFLFLSIASSVIGQTRPRGLEVHAQVVFMSSEYVRSEK